jgi:serine/threonine-protein kinase
LTGQCPRCGKAFPDGLSVCPDDGATLVAALLDPGATTGPQEGTGQWEAAVRRDILIGTQVGEYVVRRQIGSGGMGIVYEAEQPQIGRKVAVKFLRPEVERVQPDSLVGEARAQGRIRHPAIVDVFGYGEIPDIGQYLVMEYLEGRTLDVLLEERGGGLSAPEVLWLLDGVLAGLGAAHAEGVIHRDLKPSNVFVVSASGGSQHVKILDFGLAKTQYRDPKAPSTLQGNKVMGTPEYMAPEQVVRQAISERTDLYSLGVIAFEMLTGERLFHGETVLELAVAQVKEPPRRPSEVGPVPQAMDALVLQLLEKDPARRPADAATVRREVKELAQELGSVTKIGKRPGPPPSGSTSERAARGEPQRSPTPAAAPPPAPVRRGLALLPWVAFAVAGLAGGGAWWLFGSPPPHVPPEPVVPAMPVMAAVPEPVVSAPAPAPAPVPAPEPAHPSAPSPRPPRRVLPAPGEPTRGALLQRIAALKLRVQASAPPGGSPDPMMLALLARQDTAARAATDGPARAKVARNLDAFERQFQQSGDLKPR